VLSLRSLSAAGALTLTALAVAVPGASPGLAAVAPPCTDVTNPAGPATVDDSAAGTFGPLAASPVLDLAITAPMTLYEARSVPGGVLITATETPAEQLDNPVGSVSFVEYSGALRWKRCAAAYAWALAARASSGATTALIAELPAGDAPATIRGIDLASGADAPLPEALSTGDLTVWSSSGDVALFGQAGLGDGGPLDAAQPFQLLDLATMVVSEVPVPSAAAGVEFAHFVVTDDGVVSFSGTGSAATMAAYIDGAWTSDAAAIDAALPPWTTYAPNPPLTYFAASGAPAFTIADLADPGGEGFREAVSGGMVLVRGCVAPQDWGCEPADQALVGVELATGTERWRLPGPRAVLAAGDGYALVTGEFVEGAEPGPQVLLDANTGEPVAKQTWPAGTFVTGCCGETTFTRLDGGVVLTGDHASLRVYLPLDAAA
jgi:hypothetical protein